MSQLQIPLSLKSSKAEAISGSSSTIDFPGIVRLTTNNKYYIE